MGKDLFRLGLIINPVAGMGGKVGLHGTDGDLYERAIQLGASPLAADRAAQSLFSLKEISEKFVVLAPPGAMGYEVSKILGFTTESIPSHHQGRTSATDTQEAVKYMVLCGVQLILFSGGDGTARDIYEAIGDRVPILGIPAGVKMRSGVFAYSPNTAGELVRSFILDAKKVKVHQVEILDVAQEHSLGENSNSTWQPSRFFGMAAAPYSREYLQSAKSMSSVQGDVGIDELAQEIAQSLNPSRLYLFGPGATTHKIIQILGLEGYVGGIDAVFNRQLVGKDLGEHEILELLTRFGEATLFLGVIGGQGFLLGRGNQQLSAKVIDLVSPKNIVLLSSAEKIAKLFPVHLQVDLGDLEIEAQLEGYREVLVAPGRSTVCRVIVPKRVEAKEEAV